MGWQSSGDFMQGTKLNFKTKEDAVRFAQKQGYEYYVQEPQARRIAVKAYAVSIDILNVLVQEQLEDLRI